MRRRSLLLWTLAFSLLVTAPAAAQSREGLRKNAETVKQPLAELTTSLQQSIVELRDDNKTLVLGSIVSSDGLIVTKASEISGKKLICQLADGRRFEPTRIAEDETTDLALLKINAGELSPIPLSSDRVPGSGSLVVSVGKAGVPIGFGVVEVDARQFRMRQRRPTNRGYLGVSCVGVDDGNGLLVERVTDDSAARKAGIRQNDVIKSIDGEEVNEVDHLIRVLRQRQQGDTVKVVVVRGELEMTVQAKLTAYPSFDPNDQWGGGPFSSHRFGFDEVIVHDTVLQPSQCGTPLVDIDGQVVGINIARALRVASYSLPIAQVAEFVAANKDGMVTSNESSQ